ncbi:hypothetical protein D3C87_1334640 [compost metagenome]
MLDLSDVDSGKCAYRVPRLTVGEMDGKEAPDRPKIYVIEANRVACLDAADGDAGPVDVLSHQASDFPAAVDDISRSWIALEMIRQHLDAVAFKEAVYVDAVG